MTDHPFDDVPGLPRRIGDEQSLTKGMLLVGRYRLEQPFGDQSLVDTWLANDEMLSRTVLIRMLLPGDIRTDDVLAAARSAALATDSRFVRVFDAGEAGHSEVVSFIVSEFAHEASLASVLADGPLSAPCAAWLVREVADALAWVHKHKIYHSLLTPDYIVITGNGNPKIDGLLVQMALQRKQPTSDERADVLSLGALLYAALTGTWPLRTGTSLPLAPLFDDELAAPVKLRTGVSPVLSAISMRILQPTHGAVQIESAKEVATALGRILGNAEGSAELEERIQVQPMLPSVYVAPARRAMEDSEPIREILDNEDSENLVDVITGNDVEDDAEPTIIRWMHRIKGLLS